MTDPSSSGPRATGHGPGPSARSGSRRRATRRPSRCSTPTGPCASAWSPRRSPPTRRTWAWSRRSRPATTRGAARLLAAADGTVGLDSVELLAVTRARADRLAARRHQLRRRLGLGPRPPAGRRRSPRGTPGVAVRHPRRLAGAADAGPRLVLVVSGGHSSYFLLEGGDPRPLNRTRDDAAGEIFDKLSAALGLGYPGGPVVDRLADRGDPTRSASASPRIKDPRGALDFFVLRPQVGGDPPGRRARSSAAGRSRGAAPGGAGPAGELPPHRLRLAARAARRAGRTARSERRGDLRRGGRQQRAAPAAAAWGRSAGIEVVLSRRSR